MTSEAGSHIAKFFADAAVERMALSIAYGVFLQARDTLLSGITDGKWFSYEDGAPFTPNLRGLRWRTPGREGPMQGLEFFEFYDLNRELFLEKAKALDTIVRSLGG